MLNDILTLDQQWLPNRSDFPPIPWPLYRSWPSPNYEWFTGSICNGCCKPAGNAYPSVHLVPSPFLGLACAQIVETRFLELAMSLLDFSPWIPLGTFSILLSKLEFRTCLGASVCFRTDQTFFTNFKTLIPSLIFTESQVVCVDHYFLNYIVWLRITDEGSVPEMRIWSTSLI